AERSSRRVTFPLPFIRSCVPSAVDRTPPTRRVARRGTSLALLCIVCVASLFLTTLANRCAGAGLRRLAQDLAWLADATIPSLAASLLIYVAIRPTRPFALPASDTAWRPILRISAVWLVLWLAGSILAAMGSGRWVAYTHGTAAVAGFVLVAPLAEE